MLNNNNNNPKHTKEYTNDENIHGNNNNIMMTRKCGSELCELINEKIEELSKTITKIEEDALKRKKKAKMDWSVEARWR